MIYEENCDFIVVENFSNTVQSYFVNCKNAPKIDSLGCSNLQFLLIFSFVHESVIQTLYGSSLKKLRTGGFKFIK